MAWDYAAASQRIQDRRAEREAMMADRRASITNRRSDILAQREARIAERQAANPMGAGGGGNATLGALNTIWDSPVYQFPVQQGLDAINASYAGRGMLESGAAMKGIADYISGVAAPGAFNTHMSMLGNQQALGFNAAQVQAGQGANFTNSITAANTNYANALSGAQNAFANNATALNSNFANAASAGAQGIGNAYGQGAVNTANIMNNATMAQTNNTNAMIGGIGNALGGIAGYYAYKPYA